MTWKRYQATPPTLGEVERWAALDRPYWVVVTGAVTGLVAFDFGGDEGEALRERLGLEAKGPHRAPKGGPCARFYRSCRGGCVDRDADR